jgi:O-antigen ligase
MFTRAQCKTKPHGHFRCSPRTNRLSPWEWIQPGAARVRVAYRLGSSPHPRPLPEGQGVRLNWKATALALAGLGLIFTAPPHRIDLLVIGLAGLGGGLLWSPLAGPLLIGGALPCFFFSRQLVGPVSVTPPGLVLILSWLAVFINRVLRKSAIRWPRSAYDLGVAAFLTAALLSLLVTEYPLLSIRELRALIFEPVLFFWLLHTLRGSPLLALGGFLLGATVTAIAAIAQGPLGIGGTAAEGVLRAQAWYPSANHLALMLGRAWPFLVAGALAGWRWLWLPAGLVGLALILTFSTGGWLGGLAGGLVVVTALGRRRLALRVGALAGLALLVVSVLAIVGVLPERLNPLRQTGGFRLDLWQSSLQMVRDHPWLGIGLDNFVYFYQQVYLREGAAAEPNLSHPHNWLLHFWLELGVLGLIAFGWLLVRFWRHARTALRGSNTRWIVAGACGSMADLLVHGFIDNSYFLVDLAFLFWLGLALVRIDPT